MNDKAFKNKNVMGSLPLLELEDGATTIADPIAISKYLARVGAEASGDVMGATALEQAKVEQWLSYGRAQVQPVTKVIAEATFGQTTPF